MTSENGAPELASDLSIDDLDHYESPDRGIVLGYPKDWQIEESGISIYVAPSEDKFPWGNDYSPLDPRYHLLVMPSYTNRANQRLGIPESAAAMARDFIDKMPQKVIEPVTSVDIGGYDGATALAGNESYHRYIVVVRVTAQKAVVLAADGPARHSEEMRCVLNAVALSLHPLPVAEN